MTRNYFRLGAALALSFGLAAPAWAQEGSYGRVTDGYPTFAGGLGDDCWDENALKAQGFIAGTDVRELDGLADEAGAAGDEGLEQKMVRRGHGRIFSLDGGEKAKEAAAE